MCYYFLFCRKFLQNVSFQGHERAITTRFWAGKALLTVACIYSAAYYMKYNSNVSYIHLNNWILIRTIHIKPLSCI